MNRSVSAWLCRGVLLVSSLALVPLAEAGEGRFAQALADDDCGCGPISAVADRGRMQGNARVADPAAAFGGFGIAFPGSPAVISSGVNGAGEDQAVTITILAFGFGVLSTEVIDCCIQGDLFEASWSQMGPGGTQTAFGQSISPQAEIFNLNIFLVALVQVDVQYLQSTTFPAGFDVVTQVLR